MSDHVHNNNAHVNQFPFFVFRRKLYGGRGKFIKSPFFFRQEGKKWSENWMEGGESWDDLSFRIIPQLG
jgi:hypothetical protein